MCYRRRMKMLVFSLVLLAACGAEESSDFQGYVGPADRQTAVPSDLPLWVYFGEAPVPPGYPSQPKFWVWDTATSEEVSGTTWVDDDGLRFVPDEPWADEHRFLWTLGSAYAQAHGPELAASPALGEMQFSTRPRPEILGFGLDEAGEGCAVYSEPAGTVEITQLVIQGANFPIDEVFHLDPAEWYDPYRLQADDPGLDVVCVKTSIPLPDSGQALVFFGDDRTWTGEVGSDPATIVRELRRASE
jgi:hypothetical protein